MATDYTIPHDERLWRYIKGERNTEPSKSHSLSLAATRRFISKYDYLFILWLSPIGIIFLFCLWQMCANGPDFAPSKWIFWQWVIDKAVYIGGILFVALLAQKVFNDNARDRENRERKIKAIENCMHECNDLYDIIINSTKSSVNTFITSYNKGFAHYRKIFDLSELYGLDLDSSLIQVANQLKVFNTEINKKIETSDSPIKTWDDSNPLIPLNDEAFAFIDIGRTITKLKNRITRTLKDAEINH